MACPNGECVQAHIVPDSECLQASAGLKECTCILFFECIYCGVAALVRIDPHSYFDYTKLDFCRRWIYILPMIKMTNVILFSIKFSIYSIDI